MSNLFTPATATKGNPRGSGYARQADDWYIEPPWMVEALLDAEEFTGGIWDPCCGIGVVPRVCQARGFDASGSDLVDRGFGETVDFFRTRRRADNIITNPPFKHIEPMIMRALDLAQRKVAILGRLELAESEGRFKRLLSNTPLRRILVSASRAPMPPGEIATHGLQPAAMSSDDLLRELTRRSEKTDAFICFAWFIWQRDYDGEPIFSWIPPRPKPARRANGRPLL